MYVLFFYPEDFGETITTQMKWMGKRPNILEVQRTALRRTDYYRGPAARKYRYKAYILLFCDQTGKISEVFKVLSKDTFKVSLYCYFIDDMGTDLACITS